MSDHDHDHPENGAHILPLSLYIKTLFWLSVLMALTIAASFVDFTGMAGLKVGLLVANIIAVGIAVTKATLVLRNFMHVGFSSPVVRWWALLGFGWLTVLAGVFVDYNFRQYEPVAGFDMHDPSGAALHRYEMDKQSKAPEDMDFRPRNPSY